MAERYDPNTGLWKVWTKFVAPTLSDNEITAVAELVEASKVKTADSKGWVGNQVDAMQERAKLLHEKDLGLDNTGILITFSEEDLSIDALLEIMDGKKLLLYGKVNEGSFIKGFQKRQNISTGGVLLLDKQIQMGDKTQSTMASRITSSGRKIANTINNLTAIQLGVIPNLQLHNQSNEVRDKMQKEDLGVYTPDITARGHVAYINGGDAYCRVDIFGWDDGSYGSSSIGSRFAVVEKGQVNTISRK